jgi:hypothetical protein
MSPKYLLLSSMLLLQACATATGPSYHAAPSPAADSGTIYIYSGSRTVIYNAGILLDGKEIKALKRGAYFWTQPSAGIHNVKVNWPVLSGVPTHNVDVDVTPGSINYLRVDQRAFPGFITAINVIPAEQALKEIARMHEQTD